MKEPSLSDQRKRTKEESMRRAEVEYLRFLRTKEKPDNFSTLKIIGKGAFGEVKLVQRRNDGKIYALKSLVKQEMVGPRTIPTCGPFLTLHSSRKTSWPMFGQNVTFSPSLTVLGLSSYTRPSRTTHSSTCLWSFCQVVT
jgi:hypothetical protein